MTTTKPQNSGVGTHHGTVVGERSATTGLVAGLSRTRSREFNLDLYRKICFNRFFELAVAQAAADRRIRLPIYLSVGQEQIPAAISSVFHGPMIFAQHRAHSYYLSFGGDPIQLRDELLGLNSGCARGRGGSASIHAPHLGMFGHSGLMGDQVPIAVGAALASGKPTITVVGDASVEEDYVFGAMGFAVTKKAPVLFICEDNNLSILTPVPVRRSWNMTDVARSLGMQALDITDDPWLIAHHVSNLVRDLPAYLNIRTCRNLWHAGAGTDGPPEWNRYELVQRELDEIGLASERREVEMAVRTEVERIWSPCCGS